MAVNFKDEVLIRIFAILAVIIVPVAALLMYRTVDIAVVRQAEFQAMGQERFRIVTVQAERGNIYSHNNNLLATSVPYFSLHFDPYVASPRDYYDNIDSLALLLSRHVDSNHTPGAWRDSLLMMRDSAGGVANHYFKLAESVSYSELSRIRTFPIFNQGRMGGGLIVEKRAARKRPFGWLARRTIGYSREGGARVGLEGAFDEQLAGESGKQEMFNMGGGIWLPTDNLAIVEPTSGANVYTTLDVNIQDITENALENGLLRHRAEWGAAIVMDVKTGAIRAMANLGAVNARRNRYAEQYNYAISRSNEPGSTFKLATMMALLEDGYVDLDSEVDIENGVKKFYDLTMEDASSQSRGWRVISVRDAFEQSSNVGMAKLVDSLYKNNEFTERLRDFHLESESGIELEGERAPFLNDTSRAEFSGISRAWMAIGYESRLTPLQMLTFYNAVANGGRMMKPYLVTQVERGGRILEEYKPTVVDKQIASPQTIEQLQSLLEGVVERGTAKRLKSDQYRFAAKTGTSQQNYGQRNRKKEYQASFAGYFPAENPTYSIIVVVKDPTNGAYYGGDVAGPIFKEIADNIYNSMIEVHEPLNRGPRPVLYAGELPSRDAGYLPELLTVLDYVNVAVDTLPDAELAVVSASDEAVELAAINPAGQQFPNVRGMRLRDALYVLENDGYTVHPRGVGRVVNMRWQSDGNGRRGRDVELILK
ncbi:cell division protein FtsI (penicillin-binding protein 3) [Lewinella marina]|uniref:Peptidoglycan glycosyltransferase n=1 Tax=Neolewinella marina TaxID=438751 RepID=A0A2G0CIZ0_9BACT|nr:penicillin-binding transpeptidase domain-containing protein [Neolewinella marina]NJB84903.1 cell division protein FtsI (penicillin-binding protein 3) [Neolewinella marina]PHK99944.1 peptidoglycan glycosyltransferase [Neolewinella marina]